AHAFYALVQPIPVTSPAFVPNAQVADTISTAVAEQPQQHHEHVDEVEVERQRAHHCLAAGDGAVVLDIIHFLDLLGVPGGQAGEDQDTNHRQCPVEATRLEEDIDEACDDEPKQAHNQERAHTAKAARGGV